MLAPSVYVVHHSGALTSLCGIQDEANEDGPEAPTHMQPSKSSYVFCIVPSMMPIIFLQLQVKAAD